MARAHQRAVAAALAAKAEARYAEPALAAARREADAHVRTTAERVRDEIAALAARIGCSGGPVSIKVGA